LKGNKVTDDYEDSSPGWEAIDEQMARLYPDQEPRHYGTIIPATLGGKDPIEGISAYRTAGPDAHWHFVTYGFSELHAKEWENLELSGFGFELTFRLHPVDGDNPPAWALNFLQNLGRYVFQTGNVFEPGHYMNLNGPIALEKKTEIRAIAFIEDPQLPTIETPHGTLTFLQVVGITLDELDTIKRWKSDSFLRLLGESVPNFVTDLERTSVLQSHTYAAQIEAGIQMDGSSTSLLYLGALDWGIHKRILGVPRVEIVLGANGVQDIKAVLPGRLPFGRDLVLTSSDRIVTLRLGNDVTWAESSDGDCRALTITLPSDAAVNLAATLMAKEGVYQIKGQKQLTFRVEKSYIKDPDGNVKEVIG
jgi:hypothetical protein